MHSMKPTTRLKMISTSASSEGMKDTSMIGRILMDRRKSKIVKMFVNE